MTRPSFYPANSKRLLPVILAGATFCLMMSNALSAYADIAVSNRFSEISFDSTNLGGENGLVSTTSPLATFNELFGGSETHVEPGGRINTGTWFLNQNSSISDTLISFQGETTSSMTGDGSGILELTNTFEIQFMNIGTKDFDLTGSLFGTTDPPGAVDFARVQLLEFDGVTFVPIFSTGTGDDLSDGFSGTFADGGEYRLEVFTRNFTNQGNAHTSGATVNLAIGSVPEPSSAIFLGLLGLCGLKRRRR